MGRDITLAVVGVENVTVIEVAGLKIRLPTAADIDEAFVPTSWMYSRSVAAPDTDAGIVTAWENWAAAFKEVLWPVREPQDTGLAHEESTRQICVSVQVIVPEGAPERRMFTVTVCASRVVSVFGTGQVIVAKITSLVEIATEKLVRLRVADPPTSAGTRATVPALDRPEHPTDVQLSAPLS